MARGSPRIALPFGTDEANLQNWRESVTDALNALPTFSIFSTADGPNDSGQTADRGTIGIDIGSATTTFWGAASDATNDWIEL